MKVCKNCGVELENDIEFCFECGSIEFEEDTTDFDSEEQAVSDAEVEPKLEPQSQEEGSLDPDKSAKELILSLLDDNEDIVKQWTLAKLPSYLLGRSSSMGGVDIDFSDIENGEYVSRKHAKIYKNNNRWCMVDLDSKYKTELINNSKRETMVPSQEYTLNDGYIIVLAKKIKLEVHVS